jgi:twitching motility two-component system response regulator PilH
MRPLPLLRQPRGFATWLVVSRLVDCQHGLSVHDRVFRRDRQQFPSFLDHRFVRARFGGEFGEVHGWRPTPPVLCVLLWSTTLQNCDKAKAFVTWFQAKRACENGGKELCTMGSGTRPAQTAASTAPVFPWLAGLRLLGCRRMAKILIIDDSPATIKMASMALEEAGHDVVSRDGPAGLPAVIKKEQPNLILMDVVLPTMRGDILLRAMTSRGWKSNAVVLFYSSRPKEELEKLVLESGAHGYIPKDTGLANLVAGVNDWLSAK